MRSRNGNYRVSVIPIREKGFADYLPLILILLLLFVLITLGVYIYLRHPEIIPAFVGAIKERFEKNSKQESNVPKNDGSHLEMLMMVDESCANALISDSIAKSLISNVKDSIVTNGKSHAIVNIDTISETFSSGDTVDINKMKEKGLIPKDSFTVKVLARGVIDKPLTVYANDFSPSAVKMIALTGGKAVKVITKHLREKG
jgi:ribosomal protein L18E